MEEGLELTKEMGTDRKYRYLLIHTPFWRLCVEAERVGLKMPLRNVCQTNAPFTRGNIHRAVHTWSTRKANFV